jgi:hypothetical protein
MIIEAFTNSRHTPREISWTNADGSPGFDDSAVLSARKRDLETGVVTPVDGTLEKGVAPLFRWFLGVNDTATAGTYEVQFVAAYPDAKQDVSLFVLFIVHDRI